MLGKFYYDLKLEIKDPSVKSCTEKQETYFKECFIKYLKWKAKNGGRVKGGFKPEEQIA